MVNLLSKLDKPYEPRALRWENVKQHKSIEVKQEF